MLPINGGHKTSNEPRATGLTNTDSTSRTLRTIRYFLIGFLTIAALKLLFATVLDLYSDEIFYWQASTRPALAYSDLPFMAALLSGTGTFLFGNSALAVRSLFLLMGSAIPFIVYWVASPLMPQQRATEAATLTLCLPLGAFLGLLAVPDVPLLFFGVLLVGCLERAIRLDSLRYWIATGLVAALGVSTHYRFALYIVAAFIYLLVFRDQHRHWKNPGLWIAVVLLLSGLYPAVAYNLGNQLSGIDYHLLERHPWEFQVEGLLHPLKQAVLVTPLLYGALLYTLVMLLRQAQAGDSRRGLFAVLALTNLGVFLVLAPWTDSTRTSIHWPLSGYLPLLLFLPEALRELHAKLSARYSATTAARMISLTIGLGFAGSVIALLGVGSQSLQDQLRPLLGKGILSNKMAGWSELSNHVSTLLQAPDMGDVTLIVTDNYYTGAQLELSLGDSLRVYNIDADKAVRDGRAYQYALWGNNQSGLISETGKSALFVTEDSTLTVPDKIDTLSRACAQFERLEFVEQLTLFEGEKSFTFYHGRNIGVETNMNTCPKPSLGWVDQPESGATVDDVLTVSGWVINEGLGVDFIEVLIDGVPVGAANYGTPRPDVVTAMKVTSDPNAPNLGFEFSIDSESMPIGRAELSLRTRGVSGETQDFGTREINITGRN
ncbi:MAG: glycosyltransferase family 39 protein [Gammaproteobacteria bacterium]|nr:glycosyltransferase family 39 protein [Gammaproteobacteria bacterium]MDP2139464.1 glycosyltransferase family 39 protein [Gammaproteobacteria bacterium]MDP2346300.1 glycosyltransferase family 39 protein [Gammaproteobacteria bacterium]